MADTSEVGTHLPDGSFIWSDAGLTAGLDYLKGCLEGVEGVDGILQAAVSAVKASGDGEGTDAIGPGGVSHRAEQCQRAQVVGANKGSKGVRAPKHMMHQGRW